MRNRVLNPEFWLDEGIAQLSPLARLLFIGLWGLCDDNYATFPNRPMWIRAQVFPYEEVDINKILDELSSSGRILLFQENGKEFWFIKNFFKYQKIDRPSKPKYPKFDDNKAINKNTRSIINEDSSSTRTEVKLSKDKLILHSSNTSIAPKNEINSLMSLFKPINPAFERLYANKTQREALDRLIKKMGVEKLKRAINLLPTVINQPYAPQITTPYELEQKMGKLIAYLNQEKGKSNKYEIGGL